MFSLLELFNIVKSCFKSIIIEFSNIIYVCLCFMDLLSRFYFKIMVWRRCFFLKVGGINMILN